MIKYELRELNFDKGKKRKIYPKAKVYSMFDNAKMAEMIKDFSHAFTTSVISGVLGTLPQALTTALSEGHTIKVNGLGVFSLSLDFDDDKPNELTGDKKDMSHRSIRIKTVNFKPDKAFMESLREATTFERQDQSIIATHLKYTFQERARRARKFLETNQILTLTDYTRINGISPAGASRDLKRICASPDSGITPVGAASHKVWKLREALD